MRRKVKELRGNVDKTPICPNNVQQNPQVHEDSLKVDLQPQICLTCVWQNPRAIGGEVVTPKHPDCVWQNPRAHWRRICNPKTARLCLAESERHWQRTCNPKI
ncbi:Hypothetical protein FKW44_011306 [Caligus rogercresseyi]|uniref:Uncharacterized protein n=1 Tax=Caligus rogercresseyi TaxID=217165 RepID=A0A7T8HI87_CALRO|nr:Hypothetical protein FKW44_011306 [Caligus rogercresseyi]